MKKFCLILILLMSGMPLLSQKTNKGAAIPQGYGEITWGSLVSQAQDKIKGKLVFTDEKSIIISKEKELKYTYGFFYIDSAAADEEAGQQNQKEKTADEGKLFYVILNFPYLSLKNIRDKYEEKFGTPAIENISDNQGALAWQDDKTIIVIWVDRYEKRPYSRRVSYVSKEIAKEVNDYKFTMFNKTEINVLKALIP